VSDGTSRGRGDGELPPDPWAGLADHATPPPPPPHGPGTSFANHPSVTSGTFPTGEVPPSRRTLWHHPGVWVAVLVLAGLLLLGALLEPNRSTPSEPAPDAVTASAAGSMPGR
jgi:hypothetical protein